MAGAQTFAHATQDQREVITNHAGLLDDINFYPTFTLGTEAANARACSIQLKDAAGNNLAQRTMVEVYLSSTATGAPSGTAPNGATSFTTGTTIKEHTTKVFWTAETDATGLLVLTITDTGTPTFYINVRGANGVRNTSSAVTFA